MPATRPFRPPPSPCLAFAPSMPAGGLLRGALRGARAPCVGGRANVRVQRGARMALAPPPPRPPVRGAPPRTPPPDPWCTQLVGRDALETALREAGDAFVVIVFVANWCRTCKTLLTKVERLSLEQPEIRYMTVDFVEDENKALCSQVGVKLLPTFHFYRGVGDATEFMAQFTAGPFGIKRLTERLEEFGMMVNKD